VNQLVPAEAAGLPDQVAGDAVEEFVTFEVHDQLFGVSVHRVQDILIPQSIAWIPLAPSEVRGSINLRGRIVTVIDMRKRLGLPPRKTASRDMGVTVEHQHDLFTLLIDAVGDVIGIRSDRFEPTPSTLNARWRDVADGVYRLDGRLMVVLNVERLLDLS
jgi:purine-binding chemotaxis protein CheW